MSKIAYLNGRFVKLKDAKINIEDRGFQFSDSIYEVIAFKNSKFIDLKFHLIRLRNSLKFINIKYKFTNKNMEKIFLRLISMNKINSGLIYIQITRGVQPRSHAYTMNLKPTIVIYIIKKNFNDKINKLISKTAITYPDLRWKRRDIKSVSLYPIYWQLQKQAINPLMKQFLLKMVMLQKEQLPIFGWLKIES